MGYKWVVANGKLIKLWKDIWFGISLLATQFWDLYFIYIQQTQTIEELWDGDHIRGTFRRTFTNDTMIYWQEILVIVCSINFYASKGPTYLAV
jgi:hypothetical protein